jgi:hypothetical protein
MCGLSLTFETDYRSERCFVFISETRLSLVAWPTELSSCVSTRSRLSFIFDTAHEMADVDVWPCQGTLCTSFTQSLIRHSSSHINYYFIALYLYALFIY